MGRLTVALVTLLLIAGCGSSQPTIVSLRSPAASASRTAAPSPQPVDARRAAIEGATQHEDATYLPGGEDPNGACPSSAPRCLSIGQELDGLNAAYFRGLLGNSKELVVCAIYAIQDATGWHFHDMTCTNPRYDISWANDVVHNTGKSCANVRSAWLRSNQIARRRMTHP
jgi:hypothetical protein